MIPIFTIIAGSFIKLSAASIKRWQTTTKRSAARPRSSTIIVDERVSSKIIGQLNKASADYDQVIRLNPRNASGYVFRGYAYFAKGNYKAAALDFQKATQLSPADYDALTSLARFQVTCPEDSLRNVKGALEKSLRACELSNWESSDIVDTLAAAYAEVGNFDRAVKY